MQVTIQNARLIVDRAVSFENLPSAWQRGDYIIWQQLIAKTSFTLPDKLELLLHSMAQAKGANQCKFRVQI